MLKGALLAITFSALSLPAFAQLGPGTNAEKLAALEVYQKLIDGEPPAAGRDLFLAAQAHTLKSLDSVRSLLVHKTSGLSQNCARYQGVLRKLTSDLQQSIKNYSGDFELGNRIQIEIAAFMTLQHLMRTGVEGGFGVLEQRTRTTCPFAEREVLLEHMTSALSSLTNYFRATFGRPGLRQMEDTQHRLLNLALADERSENRKFWIYTGALTLSSIVLWEVAPVAVAFGARGIWGMTPLWLSRPGVVFTTRIAAITAEGFAFAFAEDLASHHPEASRVVLGSWNEYMDSIDAIVDNPVHAPQLQLVLLSRIQSLIFSESMQWLTAMAPLIASEERKFGTLANAIAHYRGVDIRTPEKR